MSISPLLLCFFAHLLRREAARVVLEALQPAAEEELPGGVFNPWNSGEYIALLDGGSFWSGGDSFDGGQILAQIMAIDMVIVN